MCVNVSRSIPYILKSPPPFVPRTSYIELPQAHACVDLLITLCPLPFPPSPPVHQTLSHSSGQSCEPLIRRDHLLRNDLLWSYFDPDPNGTQISQRLHFTPPSPFVRNGRRRSYRCGTAAPAQMDPLPANRHHRLLSGRPHRRRRQPAGLQRLERLHHVRWPSCLPRL